MNSLGPLISRSASSPSTFTAVVVTVLFCACAAKTSEQGSGASAIQNDELEVVELLEDHCGAELSRDTQRLEVLRSAEDFRTAYEQASSRREMDGGIGVLPSVDFGTHVVAMALLEEQPSCGYQVAVSRALEQFDQVEIVLSITKPGNCDADDLLSYPYIFAKIPRIDKPYMFVVDEVIRNCQ